MGALVEVRGVMLVHGLLARGQGQSLVFDGHGSSAPSPAVCSARRED